MSIGRTKIDVFRLDGGINQQEKPWLIAQNQSQDLRNWDFEKASYSGVLSKRNGYAKYNATEIASSSGVNSIYKYVQKDGTSYFLASSGTDVYKAVATVFNGNGIGASLTSDKLVKFSTIDNVVCFCNETDAPMKWTGSAVSNLGGSAPSGVFYPEVFQNRFWLARTAAYPSRLWHCALDSNGIPDPDDWATAQNAGHVDINADDGDVIVGLKAQRDRLIIFKKHSIYALYGTGPDTFWWRLEWSDIGLAAPLSLANTEDNIFFLAHDGVYMFNRASAAPVLLSKEIRPMINAISDKTVCAGGIYKNQYWLAYYVSGSSSNDRALVLNYRKGAWVDYRGIKAGCFYLDKDTNTFYAGSPTGGYVYTLDSETDDDGSNIQTYYKGPALDFGTPKVSPQVDKRFDKIYTLTAPTSVAATLSLDYAIDFVDASDTRTIALESTAQIVKDRQNFKQGSLSRYIEVTYSESSKIDKSIYGYTIYADVMEPK